MQTQESALIWQAADTLRTSRPDGDVVSGELDEAGEAGDDDEIRPPSEPPPDSDEEVLNPPAHEPHLIESLIARETP